MLSAALCVTGTVGDVVLSLCFPMPEQDPTPGVPDGGTVLQTAPARDKAVQRKVKTFPGSRNLLS